MSPTGEHAPLQQHHKGPGGGNEPLAHLEQRERPRVLAHGDPKNVLELGDEDVHGGGGGVTTHQRVREVGNHEAEL